MPDRIRQTDPARALLFHAGAATPFPSANGELCASVPSSIDSRRVLPLRSAEFRDWLTANYFSEFESAPSATLFAPCCAPWKPAPATAIGPRKKWPAFAVYRELKAFLQGRHRDRPDETLHSLLSD